MSQRPPFQNLSPHGVKLRLSGMALVLSRLAGLPLQFLILCLAALWPVLGFAQSSSVELPGSGFTSKIFHTVGGMDGEVEENHASLSILSSGFGC